jgi:hypothetical protein
MTHKMLEMMYGDLAFTAWYRDNGLMYLDIETSYDSDDGWCDNTASVTLDPKEIIQLRDWLNEIMGDR